MDKVIKRTFIFVGVAIMVLFMTGVFLPMLISTNTIPVTAILIIATTTIASGFCTIYFIVKRLWNENLLRKICDEELKKAKERPDDYTDHIC